jgi:hypothetical protein
VKALSIPSSKIEVTNLETGAITSYPSASVVSKVLGVTRSKIINYFYLNKPKPLLGKFTLSKFNVNDEASLGNLSSVDSSLSQAIKVSGPHIKDPEVPEILSQYVRADNAIKVVIENTETSET